MRRTSKLLVADEVWLATARMQQAQAHREAFSPSEIISEVRKADLNGEFRPGVIEHVHSHMVANVAPNPARYRMLLRLPNGDLRLYRPGDPAHPEREGKIVPDRKHFPAEFHKHLDWYEKVYCSRSGGEPRPVDRRFIDRLSGLGKAIWRGTSADEYVSELRKGWE
jgi:hypothetical protein